MSRIDSYLLVGGLILWRPHFLKRDRYKFTPWNYQFVSENRPGHAGPQKESSLPTLFWGGYQIYYQGVIWFYTELMDLTNLSRRSRAPSDSLLGAWRYNPPPRCLKWDFLNQIQQWWWRFWWIWYVLIHWFTSFKCPSLGNPRLGQVLEIQDLDRLRIWD